MGKIIAHSISRYNGGVAIKRKHGSSTVTVFRVYREEHENSPNEWREVVGYGPTPGDRKTNAIRTYQSTIWKT